MRKCPECEKEKLETEFSPSQLAKNYSICRPCCSQLNKEYRENNKERLKEYDKQHGKIYYENNKTEILEKAKQYNINHNEERKAYSKQYYVDNREHFLEESKKYQKENIDKINQYHNERNKKLRKENPKIKLHNAISASIYFHLKAQGTSKLGKSCIKHLPYSIIELLNHLENQFESWMDWSNYGRYDAKSWNDKDQSTWTWQIDHIKPQSLFDYKSMEDELFKECWALENLRPYSSKQNWLDGINRTRH